jgi:hypothetical protein
MIKVPAALDLTPYRDEKVFGLAAAIGAQGKVKITPAEREAVTTPACS